MEAVAASLGDFPESIGRDATPLGPDIDNTAGTITFGAFSLGATPAGPNGNGVPAVLTFRALAAGGTDLTFQDAQVSDRAGVSQPVGALQAGRVVVGSVWKVYIPILVR